MKVKKKNAKYKNYLKFELKNFGPTKNGRIDIKPLTVLIGANNSGKSYSAMLIHAIIETLSNQFEQGYSNEYRRIRNTKRRLLYIVSRNLQYRDEWDIIFKNFKNKSINDSIDKYEIPKVLIDDIFNKILDSITSNMNKEIERLFGTKISDLVLYKTSSFNFTISTDHLKIKFSSRRKKYLNFTLEKTVNYKYYLNKIVNKDKNIDYVTDCKIDTKRNTVDFYLEKGYVIDLDDFLNELLLLFYNQVLSVFLNDFISESYYLPAARSGIMQAHKALVASIIEKSSYAGIERVEVPKLSGVISDFISSIIRLDGFNKGDFGKLSDDFGIELINGSIVLDKSLNPIYPEILYKNSDLKIPLHRSSSTISELAPMILYLKYKVKKNSFLIIEEPEAHLHPAKQKILAKYLVRLIRNKVNIVLTTHSDFLLSQLNTFIKLSNIDAKFREEKYRYNKEDYLNENEISVVVFDKIPGKKDFNIKKICVDNMEGIKENEFSKVYESLYDESIKLNRDLQNI